MCYRKHVCPLYSEKGICGGCVHCEYLKNARRAIRNARIGLIVAIVIFIVTTAVLGYANSL